MLAELESISRDHVKEWFSLNNVYPTEKERHLLAERIFLTEKGRDIDSLPMAEVEFELGRIHEEFLKMRGHYP